MTGAVGGKCRSCGLDLVHELDGDKRTYHPASLGDIECSALIGRETSNGVAYKTGMVPFSEFIREGN